MGVIRLNWMKSSLIVGLSVFCLSTFGKENIKRIQLNGVELKFKATQLNSHAHLKQFEQLAHNSSLMLSSFNSYLVESNGTGYSDVGVNVNLALYNQEGNSIWKEGMLRVGMNYSNNVNHLHISATKNTEFSVDTFFAPSDSLVKDTVVTESHYYDLRGKQLQVELAMVFTFITYKRFFVQSGVGVQAAWLFDNQTTVIRDLKVGVKDLYGGIFPLTKTGNMNQQEAFSASNGLALGAYIPVVLLFRLSKSEEKDSAINLYYEAQIGVRGTYLSNLSPYGSMPFSNSVGLRVNW